MREHHHVTGTCIGSLSDHNTQNQILGLPLVLMVEELQYLLARDAVHLVDVGSQPVPTSDEVKQFQETRRALLLAQPQRPKAPYDPGPKGKGGEERGTKRARLEDGQDAAADGGSPSTTSTSTSTAEPVEGPAEGTADAVAESHAAITAVGAAGSIRTDATTAGAEPAPPQPSTAAAAEARRKRDAESITVALDGVVRNEARHLQFAKVPLIVANDAHRGAHADALAARILASRGATRQARRRYTVFEKLHERGYWLTSAVKFGGDYLVYPGDPHRYHAHFVAIIVEPTQRLSALDIVSFGRLGTVVKKAPLLCSVADDDDVDFFSLEWTGAN